MAGEIPNLNVEVLVQLTNLTTAVNEAVTGMTKISTAAKESSEKASSSFTKLKDVMLGVFGGNLLTSGVMGLQKTLSEMNLAVQDAQVESNRLDTALKNSGNTSAFVKTQVDATVKSYANLGFTHAQAAQAMGTLVTATGSVIESTKLMSMAADLARYKHEDLNTAATTLARGTQGSVKAFKELGITLDSTLPKNEAIAKAFDELNGKIGGQAVAYTHTFAGEMAVLKERFNEAALTIGNVLFPIVTKLLEAFNELFKVIKPFAPELLILAGVVLTAVTAIKAYEAAMRIVKAVQEAWTIATYLYGGVQLDAVVATDAQTASQKALAFVLNQNPWVKVVEVIALVVAAFVELWNHNAKVRDIMITVGEFGIKAFGVIIQVVGDLVTAIMKLVTGPMKLMLEALSFIHAPGAKQALTDLNGAIKDTGTWFDKAATSVTNYSQNLEQLRKATSSYGMQTLDGTSTADTEGITGNVAGGNVNKAATKIKKAQDDMKKLQDEQAKILLDRQTKMDTALSDLQTKQLDAQTKFDQTKLDIETKYQDAVEAATTAHNDAIEKANQTHQDNIISINQAALDKQKAIIQQSIDAMTGGFASVTKFDLAKSFSGTGTTSGLIASMQNQLTQILQLQKDAGDLAAKGYSQSFINQVIAQGPLVGDQMSQAILNATPQTADQIKSLYAQIDTVSNSGLDTLAQTMNDGTTFATSAMAKQYAQVAVDLQKSLADENGKYQDSLNAAQDTFNKAMTSAGNARDLALQKAQQVLTDSLTSAQQAYDKSVKAISDSTMSKLDALIAKMLTAQALLAKLGAPTTSVPTTGYSPIPLLPATTANVGANIGIIDANIASLGKAVGAGVTINAPITVDGSTAPSQIQSSVLSLAKLGALANGSGTGY